MRSGESPAKGRKSEVSAFVGAIGLPLPCKRAGFVGGFSGLPNSRAIDRESQDDLAGRDF